MTTCYGVLVETMSHRRKLTPAEREQARAVQARLDAAAQEYEAAKQARDETFVALYDADASPTSIAAAADLDRTTVAKVVRPRPTYRAKYER